ncbi:MAG: hypothetical protein HOG15_09040 [Anaerolineae bacterium]|nr:hypothetical protein [Anaerolineae bacterium]
MAPKNNIIRLLNAKKIAYEAFELPSEKLGTEGTVALLGVSPELVYKTIVLKRQRGKSILAIVAGDSEVDLKKVAKFLGEKKIFLVKQDEAEKMTKLETGGISPLALINKGFDMILDSNTRAHEQIHISGGQRGLNIRLGVNDLIKLTRARGGDVSTAE